MDPHRISHVALHVESLGQAARFYACLFGLELVDGGRPSGTDGALHEPAAGTHDACLLRRGALQIVLRGDATEPATDGRLAHVGLRLPDADVASLPDRARSVGCQVVEEGRGRVRLEDVYGVQWHVAAEGVDHDGARAPVDGQ